MYKKPTEYLLVSQLLLFEFLDLLKIGASALGLTLGFESFGWRVWGWGLGLRIYSEVSGLGFRHSVSFFWFATLSFRLQKRLQDLGFEGFRRRFGIQACGFKGGGSEVQGLGVDASCEG